MLSQCQPHSAVIGKYTSAASTAPSCSAFFFKYINNVVPDIRNIGGGYRTAELRKNIPQGDFAFQITQQWCDTCVLRLHYTLHEALPVYRGSFLPHFIVAIFNAS